MPNDVINTVTIHGTTYGIGGSGGHTIKNPAGTAMTQRSNLQFVDLTVSDDSTNDATKVESVHVIQSESELDNLPDGLYMLDDEEDTIIDSDLVGYDNTDSGLEAENVHDAIDEVVETLDDKIDISAKGVANGVAELDSAGKVPSSQLPSFVDDVIEVADYDHLPATGESGKIYVALDTNKTYRWGGSEYVEISESLALGETSSTAYRGDRGKTAYDHSQTTSGNPHNVTKSDVGLGNVNNTSDKNKPLSDATKEALLMKLGVEALTNYYETSMIVEMPYEAGKNVYVEQEGRLYRTTTSINIGDTLVPDTNCVHVDIQYMIMEKLGIDNLTTVVELVDRASSAHSMYSRFYLGYLNKWAKATANIAVNDMLVMGTNYEIVTIEDVFGSIESVLSQMSTSISNKVNKETGKGLSTNDYTTTDKNKVSKIDTTTTSISGNPISISGLKANQLAVNPIITFEPIETGTGTKSPSNPWTISGYDKVEVLSCGVNVWDEQWELGAYSATDGSAITSTNSIRSKSTNYILIAPNKSYYMKYPGGYNLNICFYDVSRTFISNQVITASGIITTPTTAKYIRFNLSATYGTTYGNNISINYPSTDTDYHTYHKATSISESLGQTVYGATWYPRTGKLSNTHNIVDLGDIVWTKSGNEGLFISYNPQSSINLKMSPDNVTPINAVCSHYAIETYSNHSDKSVFDTWTTAASKYLAVLDSDYANADATAFRTAMSGVKLCYEVNEPTEIQLTPHEISLLKDYAYVSTNGTNISLDYHNGELASLADVSQLGETVENAVGYLRTPKIRYDTVNWAYIIMEILDGILLISFNNFTGSSIPITTSNDWLGLTQFYDTLTKKNCHGNIRANGNLQFSNESDTLLGSYKIFGTVVIAGHITP